MDSSARLNQRISRLYPGLFVILLDQSGSMSEPVEYTGYKFLNTFDPKAHYNLNNQQYTKGDIATAAINTIIFEMIKDVGVDQDAKVRKKSAYLSVIGYNSNVYPLVSKSQGSYEPIDIPTLFTKPQGHIELKRAIRVDEGMMYKVEKQPYWIKPFASGQTQMALALEQAKKVADQWLKAPPEYIPELEVPQRPRNECFPPVIINITDAQPNGEGDPVDVAKQIQQFGTGTSGGDLLIFNCHFTTRRGRSIVFPDSIKDLAHLDQDNLTLATRMFEMSSTVPRVLYADAGKILRRPVTPTTRCYAYNADPDVLISFLRWGTRGLRIGSESVGA